MPCRLTCISELNHNSPWHHSKQRDELSSSDMDVYEYSRVLAWHQHQWHCLDLSFNRLRSLSVKVQAAYQKTNYSPHVLTTFRLSKEECSNFKFILRLQRTAAETECLTQASATTQKRREGKRTPNRLFYWLFSPIQEKQPPTLENKQVRVIGPTKTSIRNTKAIPQSPVTLLPSSQGRATKTKLLPKISS